MHVFLADRLGLQADRPFQRDCRLLDFFRGTRFLGLQQAVIVLVREFGVDRQPERQSLSPRPGSFTANSTISPESGRTRTLVAN